MKKTDTFQGVPDEILPDLLEKAMRRDAELSPALRDRLSDMLAGTPDLSRGKKHALKRQKRKRFR